MKEVGVHGTGSVTRCHSIYNECMDAPQVMRKNQRHKIRNGMSMELFIQHVVLDGAIGVHRRQR